MPGLKVTEFDPADDLTGDEVFGIVQGVENRRTTLDKIITHITAILVGGDATVELIRDTIGDTLVNGSGITITVNDAADTVTISVDSTVIDEEIRDVVGAALVAGTGITIAVDDAANTITISSSITQYTAENARDDVGAALVGGVGIAVTLDDAGNTITIDSKPKVQNVVSAATVTPTFANDAVKITAQAAALTLANPTGTAVEFHGIVIRIKDNGTSRSITYNSKYRAVGVTLPSATVISKTLYLGMIYNSEDDKWDVVTVKQEA